MEATPENPWHNGFNPCASTAPANSTSSKKQRQALSSFQNAGSSKERSAISARSVASPKTMHSSPLPLFPSSLLPNPAKSFLAFLFPGVISLFRHALRKAPDGHEKI